MSLDFCPRVLRRNVVHTLKGIYDEKSLSELMSPKFQKQSTLKLVGRIIPCATHIGISPKRSGEGSHLDFISEIRLCFLSQI